MMFMSTDDRVVNDDDDAIAAVVPMPGGLVLVHDDDGDGSNIHNNNNNNNNLMLATATATVNGSSSNHGTSSIGIDNDSAAADASKGQILQASEEKLKLVLGGGTTATTAATTTNSDDDDDDTISRRITRSAREDAPPPVAVAVVEVAPAKSSTDMNIVTTSNERILPDQQPSTHQHYSQGIIPFLNNDIGTKDNEIVIDNLIDTNHAATTTDTDTTSLATTATTTATTKWSTLLATSNLSHYDYCSNTTSTMENNNNMMIPSSSITTTTTTVLSSSTTTIPANNNNKNTNTTSSNPISNNHNNINLLHNLQHGLGLKYCVDKSMSLSRTCIGYASLLHEMANLHEELYLCMSKKLCPTIVSSLQSFLVLFTNNTNSSSSSSSSSSMEQLFASSLQTNYTSFATTLHSTSLHLQSIITQPYHNWSNITCEESMKQYNEYNGIKLKCGIARREAYRLREIYIQCVQEWEGSIRKLQMAKRQQQRRRGGGGIAAATATASSRGGRKMKKSKKEGSGDGDIIEGGGGVAGTNTTIAARDEGVEGGGGDGMLRGDDGITTTTTTTTSYSTATTPSAITTTTSPLSWSATLRQLGNTYNISKQCESVIHAYDDMVLAQSNYTQAVLDENTAVEEALAIEKMALDSVQHLEEERVIFVIGLVVRFLQEEKVSFENMLLDPPTPTPPTLVEPLNPAVVGTTTPREILPVVVPLHPPSSSFATSSSITSSSPAQAAAAAANFINPRRNRTQSDEPAINETRQLNLPDNIAEIRDNMRSMIGRRIHRLKTMKQVSTFNEELATAIDSFASNLKSQIERCPSYATLVRKSSDEEGSSSGDGGGSILSAWNAVISSLEMYARNAEVLSKHIRKENEELQRSIALSERGGKIIQEREEVRWKSLCDAAKIETKAKAKHKQYLLDLEKARARLTSVEEGRGGTGGSSGGGGGGGEDTNVTPRKTTKKIDKHVNKAMGKMFSILPGGGEEVMNKVLTPQQRLAIATRQLDEAEGKEGKGTESYENARFVKEQAILSYTAEAKAADTKFKSEERSEMNTVQTSLLGSVDGMRNFRDGQLRNVTSTMILLKSKLQDRALEDVAGWAVETEKRVRDHLARNDIDDTMMGDNDQFDNTGLCLKVQLVKYTDVQETIRHLQSDDDDGDDEDVSDDMLICDDGEDTAIVNFPSQEIHGGNTCDNNIPASPSPLLSVDIPTDSVIQKMDPIFSKTLTNVSIEEYYLSGWSEEDTPLYGRWLKRKGSFDISVGDWEHSGTEKGFENVWSGETFPLKRVIRFKFKRTTHLYIGPPVASVTQTQYLMKDGNDRCIVMMTVEIDGVPYSDSFAVEVRWAARRLKEKDLAIDAGVFVRFIKTNMFASKIKSGTLKETSGLHLDLFEVIKSAITSTENGGAISDIDVVDEPEKEVTNNVLTGSVVGEIRDAAKVDTTPLNNIEGILRRMIVSVTSLSQRQQIALTLFVLYIVTRTVLFLGGTTQNQTKISSSGPEVFDVLAQRVEDLTKEVGEMKAILEQIYLRMEEESSNHRDEL